MKRLMILALLIVSAVSGYAQNRLSWDGKLEHDGSVAANKCPSDGDGKPCAMIYLVLPQKGASITGDYIIGEPQAVTGGYELFVSTRSTKKKITINLDNFYPLEIPLISDGKKLVGRESYKAVIELPMDENAGKAYLTFTNGQTNDFIVLIAGEEYKSEDGKIMVNLPYGEYEYTMKADRYFDKTGKVVLTGVPLEENVMLASVTGKYRIQTEAETEVFVDGKSYGRKREIELQVGNHEIEGRLLGRNYKVSKYLPSDGIDVDLRLTGSLNIKSPAGATVEIIPKANAVKPATTKFSSDNIQKGLLGEYDLKIWKKTFEIKETKVNIPVRGEEHPSYNMIRSVDNYFFLNYMASMNCPVGFMLGTVKHWGWYASFKSSILLWKSFGDEFDNVGLRHVNTNLAEAGDLDKLSEKGIFCYTGTVGGMARIWSWCFPFVGVGYGEYQRVYENESPSVFASSSDGKQYYYYSDQYFSKTSRINGFSAEVGLMLKFKGFTLTGCYNAIIGKEVVADVSVGVGFTYNLTKNPLK